MSEQPNTIAFYWLATIITDRGKQLTCDATVDAIPGAHTRMSTTRSVMDFLRERHGEFTLLFFSLEPNEISAPAVTA
jgi:hypothetical protein